MMMLFMGYALLSTLWSPTSFSTFSTAALWWGMFLLQVMIYNLARSRDKIDALLQTCTASACVNGVIGTFADLRLHPEPLRLYSGRLPCW